MASNITNLGGYDCKFVEEPPDDLICLICTFVAKDPQQVTCCGRIYCRACLVEQKKRSSVCPHCRDSGTSFEDKKSNRAIQNLKVKCKDSRCEWIGELHKLNDHLEECQYQLILCPNRCMVVNAVVIMRRGDLADHLKSRCSHRLISCVHCKEEGKHIDITTTHLEKCPKVKIPCTNEDCKVQLPREELFNHRRDDCPFERFPCKYNHIGCTTELLRKDRESHESNDQLHLHLAIETISKMQSGIVNTITDQDGFTFKMADFENYKTKNMGYYSPPFYTKPGGYKMCVQVYANGWRAGYKESIAVFIYFMHGENDENLVWPFRGRVAITLLNQLEDGHHQMLEVKYREEKDDNQNNKVAENDGISAGYGKLSFILHSDLGYNPGLNRQYLKDDCLFFKVTVDAPEPIKPWLTCSN